MKTSAKPSQAIAKTPAKAPSKAVAKKSAKPRKATVKKPVDHEPSAWNLRLYIAGPTTKSMAALRNLEHLCEAHLAGRYQIEVVDLKKQPQLAQGDQILAVPTVVRRLPEPMRKIIGNMSDANRVLVGLDLRPLGEDQINGKNGD